MSKGGGTQTKKETATTSYAPWTQSALQNLTGTAADLAGGFLQTPSYATAGFNTDQLKGFDLGRLLARDAFTGGTTGIPSSMGYTAQGYSPTSAAAAQVTGGDITAAMNPYISGVVDAARKSGQKDLAQTQAAIGARAAASGSFGGSREAIQRGEADRNFADTMSSTVANLMSQGFDRATAIAQANAQMRQQTGLTNAEAANQAAQLGASASNAASQFGLSNAQSYAQLADALKSNNQDRQRSALEILLNIGGTQQQLAQSALDTPFTMLDRYGQYVPQQLDSTTKSTAKVKGGGASPLGQLLGTALQIGGLATTGGGSLLGNYLAPKLSDERTKTNKEKLGTDPETGLPVFAYDYRSDVEAAKKSGKPMGPKRVGVMAQDVERKYPGSTAKIGGRLAILLGGE